VPELKTMPFGKYSKPAGCFKGNGMNGISLVAYAAMIATMSGCAAYKIDKSVTPSAADVAAIREEITRVWMRSVLPMILKTLQAIRYTPARLRMRGGS
jgi:hypothetical protein